MKKPEIIEPSKYDIINDIEIPEYIQIGWQRTADIMAQVMHLPAGLVMRVHQWEIEVFISSHT